MVFVEIFLYFTQQIKIKSTALENPLSALPKVPTEKFLMYGLQKRDNNIDKDISIESFYKIFTDGDFDNCKKNRRRF